MSDCVFCKIIAGEIPAKKIYEDEKVLIFHDLTPQAPIHWLAIPKTHIASMDEIDQTNSGEISSVFEAIAKAAKIEELEQGYRVVCNYGEHGGQSVHHIHFHVIGGLPMGWPPI